MLQLQKEPRKKKILIDRIQTTEYILADILADSMHRFTYRIMDSIFFLPETLAAAAPAETAGVGSGLSRGLGWGLDVCRLPFSHLRSTHTPGLNSDWMQRKKLKWH